MALDFRDARVALDSNPLMTVEQLFDLLQDVTGEVKQAQPGDTYLLFNGYMPDGTYSGNVVGQIRDSGTPGVYDVADSEVGQFLERSRFRARLEDAVARELENVPYSDLSSDARTRVDARVRVLWIGEDASGTRVSTTSAWDIACRRYVADADGNFRIVAHGTFRPQSTLVTSELPAVLEKGDNVLVDGVPVSELKKRLIKDGLDALHQAIELNATRIAHFTQLSTTNFDSWVRLDAGELKAALQDEALMNGWREKVSVGNLFADEAAFKSANEWLNDLASRVETLPGGSRLLGSLKMLGIAGVVTSLMFTAKDASAAYSQGNDAAGNAIVGEAVAELAGSGLLTFAAGAVAALGVGALVTAGAIPTAVGGALVLVVAAAGGYFGGTAGVQFYKSLSDADENGVADIVDRMLNILRGATTIVGNPLVPDLNGRTFTVDANITRQDIIGSARADIAWRFALRELNSLVISDVSYERFNEDGSLDLIDPVTGTGSMSGEYLADRAEMLAWKVRYEKRSVQDSDDLPRTGSKPYNEDWDTSQIAGNWDYVDLTQRLPGGAPLTLAIDGTGVTLHDHQIVFGSKGNDSIAGEGYSDRLYGGSGNDTIEGKAGDDYLEGGAGEDRFIFNGSFGKDVLFDSDGAGRIHIGEDVLAHAVATGVRNTWRMKMTDGRFVDLVLRDDAASVTGRTLVIQDGTNSISIKHFNLSKAQSATGYLGIKLETGNKVALLAQSQNFWADPAADISTLTGSARGIDEGGGRAFHVSLSQAAKSGDTVTIQLLGLSGKGVSFIVNGERYTGDSVLVQLAEGQTQLAFSVNQDGNLSADASGSLKVVFNGQAGTSESNSWAVNLHDAGNASGQILGDLMTSTAVAVQDVVRYDHSGSPVTVVRAGETVFAKDANGNLVAGGDVLVTENVIYGTAERDDIDAGVGDDLVSGGTGNDTILGGAGNDMLAGGVGNDLIKGGEGDDFISSAANADSGLQQHGPGDLWAFWGQPANATVLASGSTWGVFNQGGSVQYWAGMGLPGAGNQSDVIDGGAGDDQIIASWGADRVIGGEGGDTVVGLAGDDIIEGENGADDLWGDGAMASESMRHAPADRHGKDNINGGAGNDRIHGGGQSDVLHGGGDNDTIWGDTAGASTDAEFLPLDFHGNDLIDAGDGDDAAEGNGGDDTLYGGAGKDELIGDMNVTRLGSLSADARAWGADYLDGGTGDDWLTGSGGDDTLMGGADNDQLVGDQRVAALPGSANGKDYLDGGQGNDRLTGGGNDDVLYGGSGNDLLEGDDVGTIVAAEFHGSDYLDGQDGNDEVVGGAGSDRLFGGTGSDTLWGDDDLTKVGASFHAADALDGGEGDDVLIGGGGNDTLVGGTGNDYLEGDVSGDVELAGGSDDVLEGGDGADVLSGNRGDDELRGGDGDDALEGGKGNDLLDGGAGANYLQGGEGDDLLYSRGGDHLEGGAGNDTYDLSSAQQGGPTATIVDNEGNNVLLLDGGSADYQLYVQDGLAFLASSEHAVVSFAGSTDLAKIKFDDEETSLADLAQDPSGRGLRSMAWSDGQLVSTADIDSSQELKGTGRSEALDGGAADDVLDGNAGDDVLAGGAGNDRILGGTGADVIIGGRGDDLLFGGSADRQSDTDIDIYQFNVGDGTDQIDAATSGNDGIGRDVINFGVGIDANSVQFTRGQTSDASGHADLIISYGTGDSVTVTRGALANIAEIRFADGTALDQSEIIARLSVDGDGSDRLVRHQGESGADEVLLGGGSADTLIGGAGNDILIGGAGSDLMDGWGGRNTYVFGAGSGADEIRNQSWGSAPSVLRFTASGMADLQVFVDGPDVVIRHTGTGDVVRVRDLGSGERDTDQWSVMDRYGQQVSVTSLLTTHGLPASATLDERRADFLERQHIQLGTAPQRSYETGGNGRDMATPVSVTRVAQQTGPDGQLSLQHYLSTGEIVRTTTSYELEPVYQTTSVSYLGTASRYVPANGSSVPEGAQPVYKYVSDESQEAGRQTVPVLVGYMVPGTEGGTRTIQQQVGWQSRPVHSTTILPDDHATQTVVTGAEADDVITTGTWVNGHPALFRGTISVGEGNDQVLLASGANVADQEPWSRFDEWMGSYVPAQYWQPPSTYDRGLGAWVDLGAGDDIAHGTDGEDFIIGGTGKDYMDGQAGSDTYYVSHTPGDIDRVSDLAHEIRELASGEGMPAPLNFDTVEFDATVAASSLSYRWVRSNVDSPDVDPGYRRAMTLQLFTSGEHFLNVDYLASSGDAERAGIEYFRFADGVTRSLGELLNMLPVQPSAAPELVDPIESMTAGIGGLFTLDLKTHFSDPDGDLPVFTAELEDGSPLPWFVSVDEATGLLCAEPGSGDMGSYSIRITATDYSGQTASTVFHMGVIANGAPVVVGPTPDPLYPEPGAAPQQWQLPLDIFADPDVGDQLSYSVVDENGDPAPAWLHFDAATGILSSTVPAEVIFTQGLRLRATDRNGAFVDAPLTLEVAQGVGLGGDADDIYSDTGGVDLLFGAGGNDTLEGGWGNDVLNGGSGEDYLAGGEGADAYVFAGGFGSDVVDDSSPDLNHAYFYGRSPADFVAWRTGGGDLVLRSRDSGDAVEFTSWFSGANVFELHFDGGEVWDAGDVLANLEQPQLASQFDDAYYGVGDTVVDTLAGKDWISAGAGTHVLRGGEGDDEISSSGTALLEGGEGDDVLSGQDAPQFFAGGSGADHVSSIRTTAGRRSIVAVNVGDGQDIVQMDHPDRDFGVLSIGNATLNDISLLADETGQLRVWFGFGDNVSYANWFDPADPASVTNQPLLLQLVNGQSVQLYDLTAIARGVVESAMANGWAQWSAWDGAPPAVELADGLAYGGKLAVAYAAGYTDGLSQAEIQDLLASPDYGEPQRFREAGVLDGTAADDQLAGTDGADRLSGFAGDDELYGNGGADTLVGGEGNDYLAGAEGSDRYVVGPAFGKDWIFDGSAELNHVDLGGWSAGDFVVSRVYDQLVLRSMVSGDRLEFESWFSGGGAFELHFDGGVTWDALEVESRLGPQWISEYDDVFYGEGGQIDALGGNDEVYVEGQENVVDGGAGDDQIYADGGINVIRGAQGADGLYSYGESGGMLEGEGGDDYIEAGGSSHFIAGGAGSDTIEIYNEDPEVTVRHVVAFNIGDGHDAVRVSDNGAELGVLSVGGGATLSHVNVSVNAEEGSVTIHIGAQDSVTYLDWFDPADLAGSDPRSLVLQLLSGTSIGVFDLGAVVAQLMEGAQGGSAMVPVGAALAQHELVLEDGVPFGGGLASEYASTGSTRGLSSAQILDALSGAASGAATATNVNVNDAGAVFFEAASGDPDPVYASGGFTAEGGDIMAQGGVADLTLAGNELDNRIAAAVGTNVLKGDGGTGVLIGAPHVDMMLFGEGRMLAGDAGADSAALWFHSNGDSLKFSTVGSEDYAVPSGGRGGLALRLESIIAPPGKLLPATGVHALVEAMAGFAPPALGETASPRFAAQLGPTLAANWQ